MIYQWDLANFIQKWSSDSAEDPSLLAPDVEVPGENVWNEHLPDLVEFIAVEDAEPNVGWQDEDWSWKVADAVPDPIDKEICDTWNAKHIKVFARAIWVQLLAGSSIVVVPETIPLRKVA